MRYYSETSRILANKRKYKECIHCSIINERISDVKFRRMIQISRGCFKLICQRIKDSLGEHTLKSEAYISVFLKDKDKMYDTYVYTNGGYSSDEVTLAITLCLLEGGDSLDLVILFF